MTGSARGREPGSRRPRPAPAHVPERRGASGPEAPRSRFLSADAYRVEREWRRYEGTAQRDLFRELRERFLDRHAADAGWAADLGSGPGRFAPRVGLEGTRCVLLDLSDGMLRSARGHLGTAGRPRYAFVRGDAAKPPLRRARFAEVVALGNPLGFAGAGAERFLAGALPLVAPGGTLLLEYVAGAGERSRYLARLPPGAVRRTLAAPLNLLRSRVEREGFLREPPTRADHGFRRYDPEEMRDRLREAGLEVVESMAVAPALGLDPERIAAVRPEPASWRHLLELEEALGLQPMRLGTAAAVLVAARRAP